MGSSCLIAKEPCPQHPDKKIEFICLHPRCIEPLCSTCLKTHHSLHQGIGSPPNIESFSDVQVSMMDSIKNQVKLYNQLNQHNQSLKLISASDAIKQMTREYFQKRRPTSSQTQITAAQTIKNIELSQYFKTDTTIKLRFQQFLRESIAVNKNVVQTDYSHLY